MVRDATSPVTTRVFVRTEGNHVSAAATSYVYQQDTGKQIFFELYQFRTVGFANTESCRFGGYVVEGN